MYSYVTSSIEGAISLLGDIFATNEKVKSHPDNDSYYCNYPSTKDWYKSNHNTYVRHLLPWELLQPTVNSYVERNPNPNP